jgi:peptidoglycan/LPS O-acetylase OafA/YrhL
VPPDEPGVRLRTPESRGLSHAGPDPGGAAQHWSGHDGTWRDRRVPPRDRVTRAAGLPHRDRLPGLDGLRALAVMAVLLFHLDPGWLPGGFLGVDVFFVVSGFLITTLLIEEGRATGRVDLLAFWTRRARRLLPALAVCIPICIVIARVVEVDLLVGIGRQALGALTFSTNWLEIRAGSDYFDQTAPQLFMNLWSLAVEEQFYLLWPFALLVLIALPMSAPRRVAVVAGIGLASALLMAVLYDPASGATRVYYGTDTHLVGLMLGAALAVARSSPGTAWWFEGPAWARWQSPAAAVAWATMVALVLVLDESRDVTFVVGFLLASAATTVVVAAMVTGGLGGRAMSGPLLTWVGRRSYGIYLWHWPVIVVVGLDLPTAPGTSAYLLSRLWCVVVTLVIADLSFRLVETPVRRHGFTGAGRRLRARMRTWSPGAVRGFVGAVVAVGVAASIVVAGAPETTSTAQMLEANEAAARAETSRATASSGKSDAQEGGGSATDEPTATPSPSASRSARPPVPGADYSMPSGREIDGFGDSMMVGSYHALRYYFPGIDIDAKSNRRWADALREVSASGAHIRRAVVLSFGTNAGVEEETVRKIVTELGPKRLVVLVNLHARFSRIVGDNAVLAAVAKEHDNVVVADWDAAVSAHPDQLQPDGIHPSLTGAHLYAKTVRQAFADLSESLTGTKVKLKDLPIP